MFKSVMILIALISIIGCETVPKFKQAGYNSEQDYTFSQTIGSSATPKRIEALKSWGINNNQELRKITLEIKALRQNNMIIIFCEAEVACSSIHRGSWRA